MVDFGHLPIWIFINLFVNHGDWSLADAEVPDYRKVMPIDKLVKTRI